MKGPGREENALAQLLKLARVRMDELQAHLVNLDVARASGEKSLDGLAQAVRAEEASAIDQSGAAALDFSRYLAGAEEKRKALQSTCNTLAVEIASARAALQEAFAETKKLEHLIAINRCAVAQRAERTAAAIADDLAAMRRARR